ncbi:MAG TPA: glycoside hydrolase family 2 TIM barrel-domain containing protein [archaeon]|nr:glycoside hydrolase family 2 TIM barrel-domain containing protein [archaeon]
MKALSRRRFIKHAGTTGLVASLSSCQTKKSMPGPESGLAALSRTQPLNGIWLFKLDPQACGEAKGWHLADNPTDDWKQITVPHTWQVCADTAEYMGVAWYRKDFEAPDSWAAAAVRVEFEAVYHSACVWLNGTLIGRHLRKGYTAFTLDISSALRPGSDNTLVVKVENSFDRNMLPRGVSFDWTTDGGIIRPVNLLISPKTYIERVDLDARPDLGTARASLDIKLILQNSAGTPMSVKISYRIIEDDTCRTVLRQDQAAAVTLEPGAAKEVVLPTATLDNARLWHFDHPDLYRLAAEIEHQGKPLHQYETTFGVRKIEVRDGGFYLNGERVWLMGVERMGGSHPDYGMAEPASLVLRDHNAMKELNCVFTRVHWQQDKRVLDYCDRQGILIQVEVPTWGPDTFNDMGSEPDPIIMQNGLEQLREMIDRDRNHPSIFAWGLCNEVNGQNPPAYRFVERMYEEAERLDPHRLRTYASNSLQTDCGKDAAGLMDFIEWNEYYETWYKGTVEDVRKNLKEIHRAFPDKMLVISEYGFCQCRPAHTGGDARMIEILRSHTDLYRDYSFIGGAIFFCYNDYRTHIGDKGLGVLKQRVHGVVDLYGERKPSFEVLRRESSPVELLRLDDWGGNLKATVITRKSLPAYRIDGYRLRWIVHGYENLPMEQYETPLPALAPGEQASQVLTFKEKKPKQVRVDIIRPTGFSVLKALWKA